MMVWTLFFTVHILAERGQMIMLSSVKCLLLALRVILAVKHRHRQATKVS